MRTISIIIFILIVMHSCKILDDEPDVFDPEKFSRQKILFEYWVTGGFTPVEGGLSWGYYIDNEGNIVKFDRAGQSWGHPLLESISENLLLKKYTNTEITGTVDLETLKSKFVMIGKITNSTLGSLEEGGYDMGTSRFLAYRYDVDNHQYHPILLKQNGNPAQSNLSSSAKSLYDWLFDVLF